MYESLFRNKWAALAFVVLVLAGVQYFVGREGEDGTLAQATDELADQSGEPGEAVSDAGSPPDMGGFYDGTDVEFMSDEELIDTAEGFDPTPYEDEGYSDGDSEEGITASGDPEPPPDEESEESYEE